MEDEHPPQKTAGVSAADDDTAATTAIRSLDFDWRLVTNDYS